MTKVRLTKTDDPDIFELEEVVKPTLGDQILIQLRDMTAKVAALDAVVPLSARQLTAKMLATPGTFDGEVRVSSGYYSPDDGGGLSYRWNASSTDKPDGVDAKHPGLIHQPTNGPGRWIAMVDQSRINARWFGVKADGKQDDTKFIQAAIDRAINVDSVWPWGCHVVTLPNGLLKTTDTIHIGYGDRFCMLSLQAETTRPSYYIFGCVIRPAFTDAPVINIQGARHTSIEGLGILGTLKTTTLNSNRISTEAEWDAAVPTHPRRQFAGIAIDAYSGTEPKDEHYTNAPNGWNKRFTSDVRIRNCYISNVGCGVIIKPSGGDGQGDYVECENCRFDACKYAFSVNGSQTRGNRLTHCTVNNCYAAIGFGWFGPGLARDMWITGTAMEGCTWMIRGRKTDWVGQIVIRDSFGERCDGIVDIESGGNKCHVSIRDNSFVFFSGDDSASEARQHVSAPACGLDVSHNRFVNNGLTRPTFIVRSGSQTQVQNNVFHRVADSYCAPPFAIVPASIYRPYALNIQGNSPLNSDRLPRPDLGINGSLLTAKYEGGCRYSGKPGGILALASEGDILAHANHIDSVCTVYRVMSIAGGVATIEQLNNRNATDPIDVPGELVRLSAARIGWKLN